jgi:hypothetical protein
MASCNFYSVKALIEKCRLERDIEFTKQELEREKLALVLDFN